jgi:transposase InsO family protein
MLALDLYERKVIGRALSAGMETVHTTILAVETAFANRRYRETPIFHSGRGCGIVRKPFMSGRRACSVSFQQQRDKRGTVRRFAAWYESYVRSFSKDGETFPATQMSALLLTV